VIKRRKEYLQKKLPGLVTQPRRLNKALVIATGEISPAAALLHKPKQI
jgi:hypothetical protein